MLTFHLRRSRHSGGVLVSALVFAAIISLFALGVAVVAVSHISRGAVEADFATAIQLADAGINHEIRWLSQDTSTAGSRAHQMYPTNGQSGPYSFSNGDGTSFTVAVLNADGTGPWSPPNPIVIRSTGSVNGVARTVEITGKRASIFGEYAIYTTVEGTLTGSGSTIIGNVGTNGPFTFNGGNPESNIQGELTFNGYPDTYSELRTTGSNVWWNPDRVEWPTVDEIANQLFPQGGLSWLSTNNDNDEVLSFLATDPESLISNATVRSIGTGVMDKKWFNLFSSSQNEQDKPGGSRYQNGYEGLYGNNVIIFPPGDYYFKGVKMSNGNGQAILVDNEKGMVRFWFDGGSAKDSFDCPVIFTSPDKNKFRLYYNNCSELSILGNSTFNGSIYAHRDGCDVDIKIGGNSVLNGALIAKDLKLHGNSVINFPNGGGGESDDDYALFYGFMNTWREVNPSGGALFPDGTSR